MKVFIFILIFSFSFSLFACEVNSYEKIIKINDKLNYNILKSTTCSQRINQEFVKFLENANGSIDSKALSEYFKNKFNQKIVFYPKKMSISHLSSLIEEKINNSSLIVTKIKSKEALDSFNLEASDTIFFDCKNCNFPGKKHLLLKLNKQGRWIEFDLLKKSYSFVSKKRLNPLSPLLLASDFSKKTTLDHKLVSYFDDIKNIHFYKLKRSLQKGEKLKTSDLRAKTIIKYGQKVKISLMSKNIKIQTSGKALKSGIIGDYIEVKNTTSQKNILGKIINYNQILVEL